MRPDTKRVKSFMKYVLLIKTHFEGKIESSLTEMLALVFNGWKVADKNYIGVFVMFPSRCEIGCNQLLLIFSPMGEKDFIATDEHIFVFNLYP